jgi:hypothetical protein
MTVLALVLGLGILAWTSQIWSGLGVTAVTWRLPAPAGWC